MNLEFYWKTFNEFDVEELYKILSLRQQIFIVDQKCLFLDADFIDQNALHLICKMKNEIIGYLRVIPPGEKFTESSFGRVFVVSEYRNKGIAGKLVKLAIDEIKKLYPKNSILIDAQINLEKFYNDHGFIRISSPFDDEGIIHIKMLNKV